MAKIPLFVLSFLLAMVLWVYVQVQEKPPKPPQTSYQVKVQLRHLPERKIVIQEPKEMKFFPQGSSVELARIDPNDLSAYIDLAGPSTKAGYPVHLIYKGDAAVTFEPRNAPARVVLDDIESRPIRVDIQVSGGLTNPDYLYQPEQTFAEPLSVTVTGPKTDVDHVVAARAILDLTRVSPGRPVTSDVELLYDVPKPESIDFEPKTVSIHPAIAVAPQERSIHITPNFKGHPADGYYVKQITVSPEEVRLRGSAEVLTKMLSLSGKPIDITGLKETTSFSLEPDLHGNAFILPPLPITVTVVIDHAGPVIPAAPAPTDLTSKKNKKRA
jgi:YbbR domain-containing protein